MYLFGYFVLALANILNFALMALMWIVVARAVLSWVSPDPYNPIVRFIHNVTEPILYWVRSRLPVSFGGIDFSPIIVILAIYFIRSFVVNSLFRFSGSLF